MKIKLIPILIPFVIMFMLASCDAEITENYNYKISYKKEETPIHPKKNYDNTVVLVRTDNFIEEKLGILKYDGYEQLFPGSNWYRIKLNPKNSAEEALDYLKEKKSFDDVDFEYIISLRNVKKGH
jgi:hypothetical protein